jgi:hypothetical protein
MLTSFVICLISLPLIFLPDLFLVFLCLFVPFCGQPFGVRVFSVFRGYICVHQRSLAFISGLKSTKDFPGYLPTGTPKLKNLGNNQKKRRVKPASPEGNALPPRFSVANNVLS